MNSNIIRMIYSGVNVISSIAAKRVKNPFKYVARQYGRAIMKKMHMSEARIEEDLGNDKDKTDDFYENIVNLDRNQAQELKEDGEVMKDRIKNKIKTKAEVVQFVVLIFGVAQGMNISNIVIHVLAMIYRLLTEDNKTTNMAKLLLIFTNPLMYVANVIIYWFAVFKYKIDEELVSIMLTGLGIVTLTR